MSVFSKPPNDGKGPGAVPKPEAAPRPAAPSPPKPAATQPMGSSSHHASPASPAGPPVIVSRSIDIGGAPKSQSRPSAPTIQIGPPTKAAAPPAAAPPVPPKAPTLKLDLEPKPASVRPMAPAMTPGDGVASIADTFEKLLASDLEVGFEALEKDPGSSPHIDVSLTDLAEVRSLFAQLAANHVRQVRDFMIDLRWSDATVDWIGICDPALKSLRRAADKLELGELCAALDLFSETLAKARAPGAPTIEGTHRESILECYKELAAVMPQAFALDMDRSQREAVILQSLLLQVPDVKKVTIDKLYAAGLTTLEAMLLATPGDVAATTGIDEALAARIVQRFREYREHLKTAHPDATRAQERERVSELTARLRREHEDFEVVAKAWSREAEEKKKELRKARAQTLLDIQVILARLGEVERLKEIERLPFDKKLAHLESFLEEARDKYVAQA
ncbi:MAG TPA: helix-hairpin-helix domain-containing protein [Polyangiaceae bacterium]